MEAKKEQNYESYIYSDSSNTSNAMKMYLKEIEENPNKNITYNEWKKNNLTNSIPSVDLIGEKFKKTIYIENKNFSIFNKIFSFFCYCFNNVCF